MNEDVQYESGTSSLQVRMCSTSKADHQFWNRVCYYKIVLNEWVITLTNLSGENGQ